MGPTGGQVQQKPSSQGFFRDALQSASNAVASNVSGPVDLIGAGLRKVGVPVPQDAVGSSSWMEQRGLTRQVPQGAAQVVGETLGLSAPIVAAANAPKIAQAVQAVADDFQAYNKALGPAGASQAVVWHGSPHKFEKFDSSKIGTGEGAQAYGHGLYLAESPEVARSYKSAGSDPSTFVPVRSIRDPAQMAATALERAGGDMRHAMAVLSQNAQSGDTTAGAALQMLKQRAALPESKYAGNLYKVDLPDEMIGRMLDWDKPLSQQAAGVQKSLRELAELGDSDSTARWLLSNGNDPRASALFKASGASMPGVDTMAAYPGSAQMSEALRKRGVPGIRYLDGGSRGAGSGTSNFVVFPGEENALRILERNGSPVDQLFAR